MGTKATRDSGISGFVGELLDKSGFDLYEKWYAHIKQLHPDSSKVEDSAVRDEMLGEILPMVTDGNSLILSKKDKLLVESLLNLFLRKARLLS